MSVPRFGQMQLRIMQVLWDTASESRSHWTAWLAAFGRHVVFPDRGRHHRMRFDRKADSLIR